MRTSKGETPQANKQSKQDRKLVVMGKIFEVKEATVVREQVLQDIINALGAEDIRVESGAIAYPVADGFAKITVTLPKGPRGGDGWEPLDEAEAFAQERQAMAEKKAEAARKKEAKIASNKAKREAKANQPA